jgi:hypothetical protein
MSDRTEEFLRRGLMACERPRHSPDLVSDIVRAAQAQAHSGRERAFARRLYLLRAYWAVAGVVSVWILWSAPWPAWYSVRAAWLVPVCGAALLCSAGLIRWISTLHGDQRS